MLAHTWHVHSLTLSTSNCLPMWCSGMCIHPRPSAEALVVITQMGSPSVFVGEQKTADSLGYFIWEMSGRPRVHSAKFDQDGASLRCGCRVCGVGEGWGEKGRKECREGRIKRVKAMQSAQRLFVAEWTRALAKWWQETLLIFQIKEGIDVCAFEVYVRRLAMVLLVETTFILASASFSLF